MSRAPTCKVLQHCELADALLHRFFSAMRSEAGVAPESLKLNWGNAVSVYIYTDGSYDDEREISGWAFVVVLTDPFGEFMFGGFSSRYEDAHLFLTQAFCFFEEWMC